MSNFKKLTLLSLVLFSVGLAGSSSVSADDAGNFFDLVDEHFVNTSIFLNDAEAANDNREGMRVAASDFLAQNFNSLASLYEIPPLACFETAYHAFAEYMQGSIMTNAALLLVLNPAYPGTAPSDDAFNTLMDRNMGFAADIETTISAAKAACER